MDMGWTILVLIHKGNTDTQGVGLLEYLWEVVEAIIDTHLRSSVLRHDVLHGFRAERVTGTAILYLNLTQEFSSIDQDPLLRVFLDLQKSYNNVDWGLLLETLG